MLYKVIACEIAFREVCWVAAQARNVLQLEFLTQGYHDNPATGLQRIQARVDAATDVDAVLLGYALCNNMLVGLTARDIPLVIPKAHDCITFFLGSKERYAEVFQQTPGTYYYTSGWLEYAERGSERVERPQAARLSQSGTHLGQYQEWVEKYGEDNAKYLMEVMGAWTQNYTHGAYIRFDFERELHLRERVLNICRSHGWEYTEMDGDIRLLQRWVNGEWDENDFLIVPPGQRVVATYDEQVIGAA
jgi:hypothetical protein